MCYCEHENGGNGKNGMMCGLNGQSFANEGYCGSDEFCAGAIKTHDPSTYIPIDQKTSLCSKGIATFIIVFPIKLYKILSKLCDLIIFPFISIK